MRAGQAGRSRRIVTAMKVVLLCMATLSGAGCLRGCTSRRPPIHLNPNMDAQPKYKVQAESRFFYNGSTTQLPPRGTVARGAFRANGEFYSGRSPWGFFISTPLEADSDLLERGQERFQIYCSPCHGPNADGQSKLLEKTGVTSANLLEDRIREMPDGRIFQVISKGQGLMPAYSFPIPARDRWAIVAFLRTLQGGQPQ